MIKAIIFDCFGVLVQGTLEQFIDLHLTSDPEHVKRAHELNDQCSLGLISYEDQIAGFSEMSGLTIEQVHTQMDHNPRNKQLLEYIRLNLKPKYRIGLLSNAGDDWMEELLPKEDLALFDDVVLSYAVKLVKPDARIFELAANRLGVEPQECIFVDDIERYCTGAQESGMHAVVYRIFSTTKQNIEKLIEVTDTDK
jgi:epoxide hydrolase-like predicted phosphatase